VLDLRPRKIPTQSRARATVTAILDACAQLLDQSPYETVTTNAVSERAGVSIGTLYEYFPNKEAIVAALAARSFERVVATMTEAAARALRMPPLAGCEHLLASGVGAMTADACVFKVLLREAPFVLQTPEVRRARAALDAISQSVRAAAPHLDLPMPEADAWLISQMLYGAMVEIACLDVSDLHRSSLVHELARLVYRMALGADPAPTAAIAA
jgi:AcrR family transcriptional regulator